jgi:hypothetical protein
MGPGSNAGGEFGLGGVSFTASGPGKYARFAPARTVSKSGLPAAASASSAP